MTGGRFGYLKNPGGHAKIKGIFGRKKLVRVFLKRFFHSLLNKTDKINYFHNSIDNKHAINLQ